jgi:hypothetical protein
MMENCPYCDEPVTLSDCRDPNFVQPTHWECGLRSIIGGLNHLNGQCSCCGGTLPPDPEGMTRREAARMATQAWLARQGNQ